MTAKHVIKVTQEYMPCSLNRPHLQHSPSTWSWTVHPSSRSLVRVRRVDIVIGLNMFGAGDSGSWAICLRPSPIRSGPDPLTLMAPKKITPVWRRLWLFIRAFSKEIQKNASPADNNEHALLILERLLFLREVGDFDSKGCLLLAEEVGSGDIWLHHIDVYTKESLL